MQKNKTYSNSEVRRSFYSNSIYELLLNVLNKVGSNKDIFDWAAEIFHSHNISAIGQNPVSSKLFYDAIACKLDLKTTQTIYFSLKVILEENNQPQKGE